MKAIHVLPKALNYLATALNADKVQRLFDLALKRMYYAHYLLKILLNIQF